MINITRTPHDYFFYQVMRRKKKAMAFFARYLPKEILSNINLEDITLAESKHSSEQWGAGYSDIIYQCKFKQGQTGHLFITCEHQSTPDKSMPLRLIKYNIDTIEKHIDQGADKFPIVVNIVLYNGRKPWNYSTAFADYYCDPALGSKLLNMAPFNLISIPLLSRQEVQEDEELGFCFTALYCTGYPDPYKAFESFTKEVAFKDYLHTLSKAMRNLLLMYLGSCIDRSKYSLENLVNLMSRNPQETIEIMHSITQAIGQEYKQQGIQEGMQQGIQEGIQQGRQEGMQQGIRQGVQQGIQEGMQQEKLHIAKNMLYQLHLDMTAVSKATGLSKAEIIKLQKVAKG